MRVVRLPHEFQRIAFGKAKQVVDGSGVADARDPGLQHIASSALKAQAIVSIQALLLPARAISDAMPCGTLLKKSTIQLWYTPAYVAKARIATPRMMRWVPSAKGSRTVPVSTLIPHNTT